MARSLFMNQEYQKSLIGDFPDVFSDTCAFVAGDKYFGTLYSMAAAISFLGTEGPRVYYVSERDGRLNVCYSSFPCEKTREIISQACKSNQRRER